MPWLCYNSLEEKFAYGQNLHAHACLVTSPDAFVSQSRLRMDESNVIIHLRIAYG